MASKTCYSSLALFLILNTLFFALASAHRCHPSRRRGPRGRPTFPPQFPGENSGFPGGNRGFPGGNRGFPGGNRGFPRGFPGENRGFSGGNRPWGPPGGDPFDESTPPRRSAPSTPPGGSNGSAPSTPPGSTTPSSSGASCPREAMKFGVCANVLTGLFNVTLGQQPVAPCCTLFDGLVDLEAASCLCLALKSNVMGTNRNIPISLSVILSACSKQVPRDFQCA